MGEKIKGSLTRQDTHVLGDAVASDDTALPGEAMRDGRSKRLLGELWDEGIASGRADAGETIDNIKRAARRHTGAK